MAVDAEGRLHGKRAVVVGAGQTPGETIGNGRATALLFAREGAHLLLVDRDEVSLRETAAQVRREGGDAEELVADHEMDDVTWSTLADTWSDEQLIELTLLVGAYAKLASSI